MVQLMLSTTPPVSFGCETTNVYLVPVQPGPDTGPSLSSALGSELSTASTACGLKGRLELKSHASRPPGDLYGSSSSATHRGVVVQSLPPVSYCLVWEGRIFVYAVPPTMRVCQPLDIVSWPRFRFRSRFPVMCRGVAGLFSAGLAVTVRFMAKPPASARDSAPVTAASAGGAAATFTDRNTAAAAPAATAVPPATDSTRDRRRRVWRRRTARSRFSTAIESS